MNQAVETPQKTSLNYLNNFLSLTPFTQELGLECPRLPFSRPINNEAIDSLVNWQADVNVTSMSSSEALLAQRTLMNVYEQDLVFLPLEGPFDPDTLTQYYSPNQRLSGQFIKADLESKLFDELHDQIKMTGPWTLEDFEAVCSHRIQEVADSESSLCNAIVNCPHPQAAAKYFLIQCAADFLSEASAMGRNVLGSFGPVQSELFKVFIDEYGAGVHHNKHSSLFEDTMISVGLDSSVHHYWQYYTATSIALVNYFHFVSANHEHFFKYIGALYYTEASLAHTTIKQTAMLKEVFGDECDTEYFEEHSEVDILHADMCINHIIKPLVATYGEGILPEILKGFEAFRILQDIADEDLIAQIQWHTNLEEYKAKGAQYIGDNNDCLDKTTITSKRDENTISSSSNKAQVLVVYKGKLEVLANQDITCELTTDESLYIPKNMQYGLSVTSGNCTYAIVEVGASNE